MKNLAIIPARGGSKRIPGKNIRPFLGKPIIAYTIEVALESGLFDEVMVSTDNDEVARIAKEYGAKVPFIRSAANSDDQATISDVINEVLAFYEGNNATPEVVCCLFATSPFITTRLLADGMNKVRNEGYDSAFAIQRFDYPIFRALKKNENGNLEMFWPEHLRTRSQDLPQAFHDAGQFYFAKTEALRKEGTFFTRKSFGIELSSAEAQDIDTEADWEWAEKLYELIKESRE